MGFRKLAALKDLVKDYQGDLVHAHKDLLNKNPDVVEKFVKATLETIQHMKKNKAETVGVLVDFTKVDRDLAELTFLERGWPVLTDTGKIDFVSPPSCILGKETFIRKDREVTKRLSKLMWKRFIRSKKTLPGPQEFSRN